MRKKNLNALERMQREKIGVAGDDVASPAAHRKFEEFVVLCSATMRLSAGNPAVRV